MARLQHDLARILRLQGDEPGLPPTQHFLGIVDSTVQQIQTSLRTATAAVEPAPVSAPVAPPPKKSTWPSSLCCVLSSSVAPCCAAQRVVAAVLCVCTRFLCVTFPSSVFCRKPARSGPSTDLVSLSLSQSSELRPRSRLAALSSRVQSRSPGARTAAAMRVACRNRGCHDRCIRDNRQSARAAHTRRPAWTTRMRKARRTKKAAMRTTSCIVTAKSFRTERCVTAAACWGMRGRQRLILCVCNR